MLFKLAVEIPMHLAMTSPAGPHPPPLSSNTRTSWRSIVNRSGV